MSSKELASTWASIPVECLRHIVESMPRRLRLFWEQRGRVQLNIRKVSLMFCSVSVYSDFGKYSDPFPCTFCYVNLILKWIKLYKKSIINLNTIPHNDQKRKQVFRNVFLKIPYLHKFSDPLLWDSKLSSGASCFHWSSLRCFYKLIGVHLR